MSDPETNFANTLMEGLLARNASREEQRRALWAMSPTEREAAMWRGELTNAQLWEWARRRPDEVPQINDEWAFIALNTPEIAELTPPSPASPTQSTRPRRTRSHDATDHDLSR